MNFTELHHQKSPVLICNVWDVTSAKVAQELNFQAIGTSSGAMAAMLGYNDGEEMCFTELAYLVQRIRKSVDTPLTVDLEAGYSRNPVKIADYIMKLVDLGVVGVNIEDSIVHKRREIVDAEEFCKILEAVCAILSRKNQDVFINVRTDTFLLGIANPIEETVKRARLYHRAGGQGLFVPCIENRDDIESVIERIDLPLNVMCMPDLPDFRVLKKIGVHRISMGNFAYNKLKTLFGNKMQQIIQDQSFKTIFH